ncbi:EscU/YscU/HrcU family type III secretion system export apparatus switch protein [Bacillota bacterium Lsc_1132]
MTSQFLNLKKHRQLNGPSAAVLKYNEGAAPTIVAQGSGYVAEKIIEAAQQNQIPMQEDSQLMETLLQVDLGTSVPPQLYAVIAEIFLLLEKIEKSHT